MAPMGKIFVLKVRRDPYEKEDFGGLPPPWRFASDGPELDTIGRWWGLSRWLRRLVDASWLLSVGVGLYRGG